MINKFGIISDLLCRTTLFSRVLSIVVHCESVLENNKAKSEKKILAHLTRLRPIKILQTNIYPLHNTLVNERQLVLTISVGYRSCIELIYEEDKIVFLDNC